MGSIGNGWKALDIAVIGGGIGGLATATSLRNAGHKVTIYERADFAGEVGASISCAANGTRWLHEWNVNVPMGRPVILQKLISHDWATGDVTNVYDLADYKEKWGFVYNMFHRVDMHGMLMDSAMGASHKGTPAVLKVNHKCTEIDHEADVKRLGLLDLTSNSAIEYWGGQGIDKIVYSPCQEGELNSFYCFFPTALSNNPGEGWNHSISMEELLAPFGTLDPRLQALFKNSEDIKPWRLFVHQPYPTWQKGQTCILGDAAHPMMPDQSQGACMAIEDAAALGIIFSNKHSFTSSPEDIRKGLQIYEQVRKPRASRVQEASKRARENIAERIGFSSNIDNPLYKVKDEKNKLTIEEMNSYDMYADVERKVSGAEMA